MKRTTVLIADDHNEIREGVRLLLETKDDARVVGEAEDWCEALRKTRELSPDVILMSTSLPNPNTETTAQPIPFDGSGRNILIFSYQTGGSLPQACQSGTVACLPREMPPSEQAATIHAAFLTYRQFTFGLHPRPLDHLNATPSRSEMQNGKTVRLTSRETEVLQLIAEGQANKQIAADLSISIKTVEKHRQQVMDKLNIHNTAGLTRYAMHQGIVS